LFLTFVYESVRARTCLNLYKMDLLEFITTTKQLWVSYALAISICNGCLTTWAARICGHAV